MIKLLGPKQTGKRLALNPAPVLVQPGRLDEAVKLVGFGDSPLDDRVEVAKRVIENGVAEAGFYRQSIRPA